VDVEREVARGRLERRNFEAGIVDDWEGCKRRVGEVDMRNGEDVRGNRVGADEVFVSVDDVV
jgi:hypothetical protein